MRSALRVSFGTSIAGNAGNAIFARTLSTRLVARLPRGADWMTIARFASFAMSDGFGGVSEVALLAVVTVPAGCEVTTLEAYTTRDSP